MKLLKYNRLITIIHRILIYGILLLLLPGILNAQVEKKYLRQGNREFEKSKFSESEISYRRAIDKNEAYPDAIFNIGDALYKQKKYEEAGKKFADNTNMIEDKEKKANALYNMGNSLLMGNKVEESIETYKNSLRINPDNMEAKYNLAYAQDLLKQQQQQQQQQQQNQDNKDKSKDQEDNNDQNDQKKQDNNDKQQQQQQQEQKISKEDAERLLNAIANDEKDVQEKVKLAKAVKSKVRTLKNW